MQALAFPFDLHVLSTPPAFVLSQDQTLHKKAVKSPNLTKRQTKPHDANTSHGLAIQKLHKEKIQKPTPNPTGIKRRLATLEDFKQYAQTTYVIYNDAA